MPTMGRQATFEAFVANVPRVVIRLSSHCNSELEALEMYFIYTLLLLLLALHSKFSGMAYFSIFP